MSLENLLISKMIIEGDVTTVVDWGITADDFLALEHRGIFNLLLAYHSDMSNRGARLSPNAFFSKFPTYALHDPGESMTLQALCAEVRRRRVVAEAKQHAAELIKNLDDNDVNIDNQIAKFVSTGQRLLALGSAKNSDLYFGQAIGEINDKYDVRALNRFSGAKATWPWAVLNEATGGIQKDDYVVIYGRPKQKKTWVLAYLIAHLVDSNRRILLYTKEMTPTNLYERIAACLLRVPYQEYRGATMSAEDREALHNLARIVKDSGMGDNICCINGRDAPAGGDTVTWVQSKVEKYKPDVVIIDGMYLLSQEGNKKSADWQRVTEISRGIRSMVLSTEIPAICTIQANRAAAKNAGGNLDEIAYADAVGQDATMALRVISEEATNTVACVFAGTREFALHGFRIHGIPATNFEFHSLMTENDALHVQASDKDGSDNKPTHKARSPRTPVTQRPQSTLDEQLLEAARAL